MSSRAAPHTDAQVMEDDLARIREWAQDKLDAQHHIPWDSRRYQHLVALIDDMLLRTQLMECAGRGTGNVVYLDSVRRRSGTMRPSAVRISS
jgi:hypothetical protein